MSSLTLSQQSCVLFVSARRRDCQRFCFWSCLQPTEEEEGEKRRGEGKKSRGEGEKRGWEGKRRGEDEEEERENRQQCGLNVSGGESLLLQADASRNSPERQTDEPNLETNQELSAVSTLHRPAHLKKNLL